MRWQELGQVANLDLVWVVTVAAGVTLVQRDGRLVGLCPFHTDTNPSFAVFGEARDRCGCWSCGFGVTGVRGFVEQFWRETAVGEKVTELAGEQAAYGLVGSRAPVVAETGRGGARPVDTLAAGERLARVTWWHLARVLEGRGISEASTLASLSRSFALGELSGELLIPHYRADEVGAVSGWKTRKPRRGSTLYASAGSTFPDLYGAWRFAGREQVDLLLAEGESDTWTLTALGWDAVGLPHGACGPSERQLAWLERHRHRAWTVFDGDAAGLAASAAWAPYVTGAVTLPRDSDVGTLAMVTCMMCSVRSATLGLGFPSTFPVAGLRLGEAEPEAGDVIA